MSAVHLIAGVCVGRLLVAETGRFGAFAIALFAHHQPLAVGAHSFERLLHSPLSQLTGALRRFVAPAILYDTNYCLALWKSLYVAQNRRKPILPSLVFRAFFVVQSKRRAQRFLPSSKRPIVPWRTACVVLAMTMRRGVVPESTHCVKRCVKGCATSAS